MAEADAAPPRIARVLAPAKVNLALHVVGRRSDGYHLLDSIVVFAALGDVVTARAAEQLALRVSGPAAGDLPVGEDNLALRAARLAGARLEIGLEKRLPVAAGLGGGSADAAAVLRAAAALGAGKIADFGRLGADLPVCLAGVPTRMRGTGERLDPLPALPPVWLVLANPREGLATAEVFAGLEQRDGAPLPAGPLGWRDAEALARWLAAQRNDLEAAAERVRPGIGVVRAALAAEPGCLLARMTGSGATVFGLFAEGAAAQAAVDRLAARRPDWWLAAAPVLSAPPPIEFLPAMQEPPARARA